MSALHLESCLPDDASSLELLTASDRGLLLPMLDNWTISLDGFLEKTLPTNSFLKGLEIIKAVTPVAEEENHHPDILLTYPKLIFKLITHSANGLTRADFVMAAKIDQILLTQ
jgi:4a-hydroxytetrahydrobiopterin dehydratase